MSYLLNLRICEVVEPNSETQGKGLKASWLTEINVQSSQMNFKV